MSKTGFNAVYDPMDSTLFLPSDEQLSVDIHGLLRQKLNSVEKAWYSGKLPVASGCLPLQNDECDSDGKT